MALTITACGGSGSVRIEEVGIHRRDREDPVIDPVLRRNIAAHRGNQHQQRNTGPRAAVAPPDHRMPGKALLPMVFRRFPRSRPERARDLDAPPPNPDRSRARPDNASAPWRNRLPRSADKRSRHAPPCCRDGSAPPGDTHRARPTRNRWRAPAHRVRSARRNAPDRPAGPQIGLLRRLVIALRRPMRGLGITRPSVSAQHFGTSRFWKNSRACPGGQSSSTPNWENPIFS